MLPPVIADNANNRTAWPPSRLRYGRCAVANRTARVAHGGGVTRLPQA